MNFYTSPNMEMLIPLPQTELGPQWAQRLNAALDLIDAHNHSDGKGLPVTPAGFNVDDELEFNENYATELLAVRFISQSSGLVGLSDKNQIYVVNGELVFQDASGTLVQITSGGSVNVAGVGGITGLGGTTAAETYSNILKTFSFTQDTGKSANIDGGKLTIREPGVASAKGITLQSPSGLGTDYALTLPTALPGTNFGLPYSTTGGVLAWLAMGAGNLPLRVNAAGTAVSYAQLGTSGIEDGAITQAKRAALGQQVSSSSSDTGSATNNTSSFADVTALSVTLTTTGRAVYVGTISDGDAQSSGYSDTSTGIAVQILRDGVVIWHTRMNAVGGATGNVNPPGGVWTIDVPSAGSHTYKIQIRQLGGGAARAWYMKLIAYEL